MTTVGFIGTGHLAAFLVEGLDRAGRPCDIVLSPRGRETAARLARDFGAAVAHSNEAIAERADIVIASVLPDQAEEALAPIGFRADQLVISVLAGVPHGRIAELVRPARAVVAMMPGRANALGAGPSCLYPGDAQAQELLGRLGPVFVFEDEPRFATAAVSGGFSGMTFGWMLHVARWFERHGLDAATARQLVAATLRGNAEAVLAAGEPLERTAETVATPGGVTELGNRALGDAGGHAGWDRALDAIALRMSP